MDVQRAVGLLLAATLVAGCSGDAGEGELGDRRGPSTTTSTTTPVTTTATVAPPTTTTEPVDVLALRPPAAAASPAALADQIATAEAAIRDPSTPELDLARAGLAQQVAYRTLGGHPEWDEVVLAALPEELRSPCGGMPPLAASSGRCTSKPSDTLPAWRIVAPRPADELLVDLPGGRREFDIPWSILAAINLVETGTGRIRGTSTAGAQGPMQFLPATWAAYGGGGDINDTHDAIVGAARYLAANNGATDMDNALFRYNHSARYVRGVRLYADLLAEHPRAFFGLHHWGVWYLTSEGEVYLPVGYEQQEPIAVSSYLAGG